jgi:hypothetical protein
MRGFEAAPESTATFLRTAELRSLVQIPPLSLLSVTRVKVLSIHGIC